MLRDINAKLDEAGPAEDSGGGRLGRIFRILCVMDVTLPLAAHATVTLG